MVLVDSIEEMEVASSIGACRSLHLISSELDWLGFDRW
jgi:hypothetical protein